MAKSTTVSIISENETEIIECRQDTRGAIFGALRNKINGDIVWSKNEYNTKRALEKDLSTNLNFWDRIAE